MFRDDVFEVPRGSPISFELLEDIKEFMLKEDGRTYFRSTNFKSIDFRSRQWTTYDGRCGLFLKDGVELSLPEIYRILSLSLLFITGQVPEFVWMREILIIVYRRDGTVQHQISEKQYVLVTIYPLE